MPLLRCPICDSPFDPGTTPAMPFCSHRCKQIDLGRWLSEEQRLPYAGSTDEEEPPPESDAPAPPRG